jgi:hypothetical protein
MGLSEDLRAVSESLTMVRGNRGFGRKPSKGFMREAAQYGPVAVHHYDDTDGSTTIQTLHDPNPIIKDNRERMLSGHDGYTPSRDMKHVASIPLGVAAELAMAGINVLDDNDWPKVAAMLDDPAFEFLRTSPGKISRKPFREYIVPAHRR